MLLWQFESVRRPRRKEPPLAYTLTHEARQPVARPSSLAERERERLEALRRELIRGIPLFDERE